MISKNPFAIHGAIHTEKEYQKAIANKELLESEFSASSLCNLDCPFCYTNAHQREKGYEASLEEIDNFLGQVSDAGAKTVRIVGLGEPFLDKRVYDQGKFPFLDLSKKHGLTTLIYTNGTQINEEIATKLFEYDSSLVLKLYSFSPEVFEEMTGNKGFFTRENQIPLVSGKYIPKSLQTLIDAGFNKTNPTRLGINTVVTPQNVNEIENLYQFARFNNLATRFSGALIGQKEFGEEQVVNSEDLQSEYKKLVDWEKKFSGFFWEPLGEMMHSKCGRLGFDLILDGDKFKACCGAKDHLKDRDGNLITLSNSTIQEIVREHPLFDEFREARRNNQKLNCVMARGQNEK